jgi:G:T-mismatch repair DNA endonuclease (very short patch repair protein)
MICGFDSIASLTSHISRKHPEIGTKEYRKLFPNSIIQKDKRTAETKALLAAKHREWFKDENNKRKFTEKRSFPSEIKHWLNKGYSEEEARNLRSEHQKILALKQNNENTKKLQKERNTGQKNPMSLVSIASRNNLPLAEARKLTPAFGRNKDLHPMYGKHHSEAAKNKIVTNMRHTFSRTSKGEKALQKTINELFPNAKNNAPIGIFNVDILIPEKSLIVEYFGDFWHCNPNKWNAEDYNKRLHMTAQEKWQHDQKRLDALKDLGYKVVVIWESSYKRGCTLPEEILHA